jgi:lipopolysaccharide transport system permease protein/teichoic acid transport system permease protein
MKKYLGELYKRKDLFFYLVISGLKAQHRNSFLGYFWWLLDPLLGVLIYYFVVVVVFQRGGADYGVYLVIGMVVWRWLGATASSSSKSIISQSGIITQVYLPKVIFPLGAAMTQLINFAFGLVVIAAFLVFFKIVPGMEILWLPYIMLMQLLFLAAISLLLAYFCVFVRDIDTVINHILRLWFFGSPVIWYGEMIPEGFRWIVGVNPMAYFLDSYRSVLMYQAGPNLTGLSVIGLLSVLLIFAMIYVYSRYEHKIIKAL